MFGVATRGIRFSFFRLYTLPFAAWYWRGRTRCCAVVPQPLQRNFSLVPIYPGQLHAVPPRQDHGLPTLPSNRRQENTSRSDHQQPRRTSVQFGWLPPTYSAAGPWCRALSVRLTASKRRCRMPAIYANQLLSGYAAGLAKRLAPSWTGPCNPVEKCNRRGFFVCS